MNSHRENPILTGNGGTAALITTCSKRIGSTGFPIFFYVFNPLTPFIPCSDLPNSKLMSLKFLIILIACISINKYQVTCLLAFSYVVCIRKAKNVDKMHLNIARLS